MEDPVQALREMRRVVKPGGRILLLEHGASASQQWLTSYLDKRACQHATAFGCYWNRRIEDIVAESGLLVVESERHHLGTTYLIIAAPKGERYAMNKQ
jgi:methyltransferase OMS1